ncbi:hypothetical protein V6Z12_D01G165800 [Gossypium hirsutum]
MRGGFFSINWIPPFTTPWGWSIGFITTPLTTGHLPSQHLDPTLPKLFWTFPEGNFNVANFPSFAVSFTRAPATLANCPSFPSVISMLCMAVPKGISIEGRFWLYRCLKQFCLLYITIYLESIILYEELLYSITCSVTLHFSVEVLSAFPIFIGTSVPKTMVSPIIAPLGCKIYLFSPSP